MRILAIEPYATRSHLQFLEGLRAHSRHEIALDTLAPRKWKWRMRTSGLHFAPRVAANGPWDLLLCSDFLDLAALRALLPAGQRDVPAVLYFHENQLTYPLPDYEERDYQFTLIHLHGMLAANHVLFNSSYHRRTFLEALPEALRVFPDFDGPALVHPLAERSSVLHLGTDAPPGAPSGPHAEPRIAWNHRWEHDKDPDAFAEVLDLLAATGRRFRVRLFSREDLPAYQAPTSVETIEVHYIPTYQTLNADDDLPSWVAEREWIDYAALHGVVRLLARDQTDTAIWERERDRLTLSIGQGLESRDLGESERIVSTQRFSPSERRHSFWYRQNKRFYYRLEGDNIRIVESDTVV